MKKTIKFSLITGITALVATGIFAFSAQAADDGHEAMKGFMKKYHKAPKGVDPVCKKALDGKASAEELKALVDGYKQMTGAKAPKGDEASWKEKTSKLHAAAVALQKGEAGAAAKYKDAVNCKACHEAHKPD